MVTLCQNGANSIDVLQQTPGQDSQMFHPCGNNIELNYIFLITDRSKTVLYRPVIS